MATIELKREPVMRWKGIARCAALLGISRAHLSRVMHGERKPGKGLERRMRKLGLVPGSAA